jgi:hypothetical protein
MEFSEVLLKDIYNKVKVEGWNAFDAVRAFGEAWGYSRMERYSLMDAYVKYCENVSKTS